MTSKAMRRITIRFAGSGDSARLAAMIDEMDHYYGDPPRRADETRSAVERWLSDGGTDTRFVLILAGEDAIGFACFAVLHPGNELRGQLYLKDLFVVADWRGRGIGEKLMGFLAEFCRQHGIGRIDWLVEEERSQAFYERLGASVLPHKRFMRLDGKALANLAEK